MNLVRLDDAGVANLARLFDPPGLPLVPRYAGVRSTTSILVRGAAGSGKTTLALALALAVRRDRGGLAYYLSTEISPADARWKAIQAGVGADALSTPAEPSDGAALCLDHLALHAELLDPAQRTQEALEVAWAWLDRQAGGEIAAVVVDAYALVGAARAPAERTRVLQFLAALEERGIVPILVEEAGARDADWLAYLVDLVFELSWLADPDTAGNVRQLACPKSRYATALYGPHDYGLVSGRPAVWPPLGEVVPDRRRVPPTLLLPWGDGTVCRLEGGGVLAGVLDASGARPSLASLLGRFPWLRPVSVRFDSPMRVGTREFSLSAGPHAPAWEAAEAVRRGAHWLHVTELGQVGRRARYQPAASDDLAALARLGCWVVVDEESWSLNNLPLAYAYGPSIHRPIAYEREGLVAPAILATLGGVQGPLVAPFAQWCDAAAAGDSAAFLHLTGVHVAWTRDDAPLDWAMSRTEPDFREVLGPYVVLGLARRGRGDEARARMEEVLRGRPEVATAARAQLEELLASPIPP